MTSECHLKEHLRAKISRVTIKDKVQLKREELVEWEQLQVLWAYFEQIDKAQKQLAKWRVIVTEDNIVIHVVDQMYKSD